MSRMTSDPAPPEWGIVAYLVVLYALYFWVARRILTGMRGPAGKEANAGRYRLDAESWIDEIHEIGVYITEEIWSRARQSRKVYRDHMVSLYVIWYCVFFFYLLSVVAVHSRYGVHWLVMLLYALPYGALFIGDLCAVQVAVGPSRVVLRGIAVVALCGRKAKHAENGLHLQRERDSRELLRKVAKFSRSSQAFSVWLRPCGPITRKKLQDHVNAVKESLGRESIIALEEAPMKGRPVTPGAQSLARAAYEVVNNICLGKWFALREGIPVPSPEYLAESRRFDRQKISIVAIGIAVMGIIAGLTGSKAVPEAVGAALITGIVALVTVYLGGKK